jgi:hypothetical protein
MLTCTFIKPLVRELKMTATKIAICWERKDGKIQGDSGGKVSVVDGNSMDRFEKEKFV